MRQAVEAQVISPPFELGEQGLRQILSDVIEEVRCSISREIDGADILHSLLTAPWLQSLLKVYECLQRYLTESPAPTLDYASGLSLQLLIDIRSLQCCSEEAKELYRLLQQPHMQALLSAHDTVAQKDYEPVLPPMPDELPDEEEATRIVCLVKNKQPLLCGLSGPSHACARRCRSGMGSAWSILSDETFRVQSPAAENLRCFSCCDVRRTCHHLAEPAGVQPYLPPRHEVCCRRKMIHCRVCYTDLLLEQRLNQSAPSIYSPFGLDNPAEELGGTSETGPFTSAPCPPSLGIPCYLNKSTYFQPGLPQKLRAQSPCIRTAPPSPMQPRRVLEETPVELAKQENLDELRTTVQLAASSMESSSKDIRVLGERMVATTERMMETVQCLVHLTQVVDRLQTLLTTTSTEINTIKISDTDQCSSLTQQSRCSSSSSTSSLDAPSTSKGPTPFSASHRGSPLTTGATIKRNEITGEIFVARVIHGGLADRSGLLHAGDRIIEVNGFPVDGMEPEQVIQVVQARSHGTIMFKVIPITERPVHNQTMLYVRAMTDYSPQQDPTIPCADAGMIFKKGDILEIVDQTDTLWWQAMKLPCSSACAGLIPSTSLLKRKQREFWWSQPYQPHVCMQTLSTVDEEEDMMAIDENCVEADEEAFESEELREEEDDFSGNIEGVYLAGFRRSIRLCRRRFHSTTQPSCHIRCPSSCNNTLNNPYEEVVRYQRHPEDTHRLITLLGPSGVGVNELRRRLIEMNPNIFQGAIPHTTRCPRGYEESGREYYFTSREIFDNMVYNNRFLEFGEYKGSLYGTSIDAVKEVLNSGKICIIDIEPNAIQAVRTHELRAYIIYVKPPPLERLRETRQDSYITTNYYVNRPFKDEDFQEMEESARKIEAQYWQLFDQVIINDELQDSCVQLLTAVRRSQDEPQWVPASWIRPTADS